MTIEVWGTNPTKNQAVQSLLKGNSVRMGYFTENPDEFNEENMRRSLDELRLEYEKEIKHPIDVHDIQITEKKDFWSIAAVFIKKDTENDVAPIMSPLMTLVEAYFAAHRQKYKYFWWRNNIYSGEQFSNIPLGDPSDYIEGFRELPEWATNDGA